jgi:hypothetical protein
LSISYGTVLLIIPIRNARGKYDLRNPDNLNPRRGRVVYTEQAGEPIMEILVERNLK